MRIALFLCFFLGLNLASFSHAADTYSLDDELIYRINFGRADDVKILLNKGANPNAYDSQGDTALTSAITRGDAEAIDMVRILLGAGADPNLQDKRGNYPLIMAALGGHAEMVSMLMDKKADFHVQDATKTPVIDIARHNGTAGVIAPIQAALDKEAADAESLRTPARFKEIIRAYAFYSCSYQYWNYYLASRQNIQADAQTQASIADDKAQLSQLLRQIQTYYPQTKMSNVKQVSDTAAQDIYTIMDAMVSNRNRADKGIGKDEDAKRRCQEIALHTKVDFVPADLK